MIAQQETTTLSTRQPLSGRRAIISGQARRTHESSDGIRMKVCTVNVGTLKGRSREVVSMLKRRHADLCCVQEVRYKNGVSTTVGSGDEKYKLWYSGNEEGTGGVGIFLCEDLVQNVIEVVRFSDRCMKIKMVLGKCVYHIISAYAPQVGRPAEDKESFRE